MKKRSIGIFMSLLLLLYSFQPAVALGVDPDFEQIYEIGTRLLSDIEHEKEMYGLKDVDFNNLYIGEYIPAYEAEETGLILSDTRYYPTLEDGRWVATLICYKTDGIWNGQLSNMFVPELPEIGVNDSLKLVFDVNTGYLVKNSSGYSITKYSDIAGRTHLSYAPMMNAYDSQKLVNKRAVEIGSFNGDEQIQSAVPNQISLNMGVLLSKYSSKQEYENRGVIKKGSCWAVASKQIANYYGIMLSSTIEDIYAFAGIDPYKGAMYPSSVVQNVLANYYGFINSTIDYSPTYQKIIDEISSGRPVFGIIGINAGNSGDGSIMTGHGVAIRGYAKYTNSSTHIGSFSYVENEHYPAYAIAQSVSNNTDLPYSYLPLDDENPDYGYFASFISNIC